MQQPQVAALIILTLLAVNAATYLTPVIKNAKQVALTDIQFMALTMMIKPH